MLLKTKVRAFTLLEAIVALLVISGGLLLFQSMTQLLSAELQYQHQRVEKDWLLFADQLDQELARSEFVKLEGNRVYLKQAGNTISLGISRADDFRKTNDKGQGYQPMVKGLRSASVEKEGQILHFHFQFEQGLEREFVYRVEEKS
ncbi:Late competence protein ComGF, access of DNA to ComEA [Streptococcus sp. DD10]|uniref:competence type IV pilus minor pilin ComGF n=1 Tax=Streptococcus sp. DD10 TaxID=1777878 RepID=UPI00079C3E45|nr:competence type IV pilus minor pilin ComGF [Streptococcus sp. DD10]KXT74462.1 Late competence protein ComGF, access of DNA to ComEA [Streptococcus sp. DD10]